MISALSLTLIMRRELAGCRVVDRQAGDADGS